ncbi:aldo/keto reductase [Agromyces sp. MMS24-K17]|uniref:aldo/keto reductase n=1 Tax=Agromyces sp. MMS24-K17 TaxID=3372850 RepID=UPI003754940D
MTTPTDPGWLRPLGDTGITVSALTLGGSPLGSMPWLYGAEVPERRAIDLVRRVLDSPVRTIDTSNGYSDGESERRIGAALAEAGGKPDDVVVITKVDPKGGDYSGERVRQSVRESKERLGLDTLPLVHLHDPENFAFEEMTAPGGAVDALVELRERGEVGRIGLAGGPIPEMRRYFALGVFDAVLVHNRWTLVDRSAGPLIAEAQAAGVPVINAAVHGSGILADPVNVTRYAYAPANEGVLAAVAAMHAACVRHGVDLAAAALQFSLRDPGIATTVVGMSRPERLDETLVAASARLPEDLWAELEALVPEPRWWLEPPTD